MLKVLAPSRVNSVVMEFFIESIAVKIPTNAEIPTAMINIVRTERTRFPRIDLNAIRIFSNTKGLIQIIQISGLISTNYSAKLRLTADKIIIAPENLKYFDAATFGVGKINSLLM